MKKIFVMTVLLVIILFQGCGRKGPPVAPPEEAMLGKKRVKISTAIRNKVDVFESRPPFRHSRMISAGIQRLNDMDSRSKDDRNDVKLGFSTRTLNIYKEKHAGI